MTGTAINYGTPITGTPYQLAPSQSTSNWIIVGNDPSGTTLYTKFCYLTISLDSSNNANISITGAKYMSQTALSNVNAQNISSLYNSAISYTIATNTGVHGYGIGGVSITVGKQ